MRYLLLASAALMTFSAAPAMAQHHHNASPYFVPAVTVLGCAVAGIEGGVPQVQCSTNYVADPGHHRSNDGNTQTVTPTQTASFPHMDDVHHTQQLQLGANIVVNGDDNTQGITQTQTLTDNSHHASYQPEQAQGALNVVESGDNNTQTITQSQTLTIGHGDSGHHQNNS